MAKLADYSDTQIEKIYLKYRNEYKKDPNDKNKKILAQIDRARKKRKDETLSAVNPDEGNDLTELIQKANKKTSESKAKAKKKDNRMSQRLQKGSAPVISNLKTNILLGLAFLLGFSGVLILLDELLFSFLPYFANKLTIAISLIVPAGICAKVASFLSDDNR